MRSFKEKFGWPPRVMVKPPKLKRGEYVWKAEVLKHKVLNEEPVVVHTELFDFEWQAKDLKKATAKGISGNTVRVTQFPVADESGWMHNL